MKDWSDLRVLVAIVLEGSLAAAARRLGMHHATIGRRLSALEAQLGVKLVHRLPRRAVPTAAGAEIAEMAGRMEEVVDAIARYGRGERGALSGTVSISAPPVAAAELIAPGIAALLAAEPELRIVLHSSPSVVSLAQGQADIAVRLVEPSQPGLVARRVGSVHLALYATKDLARRKPEAWRFIGYDEVLAHVPHQKWLDGYAGNRPFVLRSSDVYTQLAGARAGVGIAMLPRTLGDRCADLVIATEDAPPPRGVWLVVHPDVRRSAAVRAVLESLATIIERGWRDAG